MVEDLGIAFMNKYVWKYLGEGPNENGFMYWSLKKKIWVSKIEDAIYDRSIQTFVIMYDTIANISQREYISKTRYEDTLLEKEIRHKYRQERNEEYAEKSHEEMIEKRSNKLFEKAMQSEQIWNAYLDRTRDEEQEAQRNQKILKRVIRERAEMKDVDLQRALMLSMAVN